jgi:carbon storage regulator CsrA
MLILSFKSQEKLMIDFGGVLAEVIALGVSRDHVSLGIDAPKDVLVDREKIYHKRKSGEWRE